MKCRICGSATEKLFEKQILLRYPSKYYRCTACDFVQTDAPHWLAEAYDAAITALDIGLVQRNISFSAQCAEFIETCLPDSNRYLDYAGGYGLFVRLMRDLGYDFYRQDIHCENLFAKHFDIADLATGNRFDLVTAFEVFEHFEDPVAELKKISGYADTIVFSTQLAPADVSELKEWWYLAPETGQHIAFYTRKTLEMLAKMFGRHYFHNGKDFHIFSTDSGMQSRLEKSGGKTGWFERMFNRKTEKNVRKSLLQQDYEFIKNLLHQQRGGK